ncbi:hypothetical protein MIMGU_mgv1a019648mg, partial [Erythranthe guttata]
PPPPATEGEGAGAAKSVVGEGAEAMGFSSICRNLHYAKRFLAMNREHSQIDTPMPPIDFGEIELGIVRGFPLIGNSNLMSIWQIPFKMSAYRVTERERANVSQRENSESGSDGASTCDESVVPVEDLFTSSSGRKSSLPGNYDQ